MRRRSVYDIASIFFTLLFLIGCSYAVSTTENRSVPFIQAGIQADSPFTTVARSPEEAFPPHQDSDQLVRQLASQRIKFAYVSLNSVVAHYLQGEPIVIVAGSVSADREAWVLATQPDLIRAESDTVREAVRQFTAQSKQLACTPLDLSEESIFAYMKPNPSAAGSKKVNISWLIDRSFIVESQQN